MMARQTLLEGYVFAQATQWIAFFASHQLRVTSMLYSPQGHRENRSLSGLSLNAASVSVS